MIQIIVHAFIENGEAGIVEVLFASKDAEKIQTKYEGTDSPAPSRLPSNL